MPLSVPEIRHLLGWLRWHAPADADHVLHWSWWRRHHQAIARICHYKAHHARPP